MRAMLLGHRHLVERDQVIQFALPLVYCSQTLRMFADNLLRRFLYVVADLRGESVASYSSVGRM